MFFSRAISKRRLGVSILFIVLFCCFNQNIKAQPAEIFISKNAIKENKIRLYKNLVNNAINNNLSVALTDSTEADWVYAFSVMELIRYHAPWAESRIHQAFYGIEKRSDYFKQALLEMLYTNYPNQFVRDVEALFNESSNDKTVAICAEYLLKSKPEIKTELRLKVKLLLLADTNSVVLKQFLNHAYYLDSKNELPNLQELFYQPFFKNATVVFSVQRKNRDYPGIAFIRDSAGNFLKDAYGNIFSVPQLARSVNNLPGYLSNGNTPQGIFRMKGFAVSRSDFIGPTPNLQLTLPYETSIQHFLNDSSITDSSWNVSWYKKLLPESWKNYEPIYESYFAGKAGRTEIIAHGSTINPDYYIGQPYYPITPTLGCLSTKEIWSEEDGNRQISKQQELVDALQKAGGAHGYFIVLEINDEKKPVTVEELQQWIK